LKSLQVCMVVIEAEEDQRKKSITRSTTTCLEFRKMLHMMKSKRHTERELSKNIPIKEVIQKSSRRLQMHIKCSVIRIREKYMIDTARKESSKVAEEEEVMETSFHKCSVEEWVVEDKLDQRKVKVSNTPLKSHLRRYSRVKQPKLQ
jgi:hypothetical protein